LADTPTSPPGFRDGIEAAAKVADDWAASRKVNSRFAVAEGAAAIIARRIRALTPDTLPTGWNSDMGEAEPKP